MAKKNIFPSHCHLFNLSIERGSTWMVISPPPSSSGSLGFPPVFLMVAERVRVAMADGRGRGRSPVGLGWTMGI